GGGCGKVGGLGVGGEIVGEGAAAGWRAPPLGFRRRSRLGRRWSRILARGRLREEKQLVGVHAFAARPVQAAQQQVEPVPQRLDVAITLMQRGQQFQDHALERGRVVGQVLGGGRREISSGVRAAHTYNVVLHTVFVPFWARKKRAAPPAHTTQPAQPVAVAGRW